MRLLFPILATAVSLLLAVGFYSSLVGRPDDLGLGVRLVSVALALGIHAWAFVYLWLASQRIETIVGRDHLPDWVGALGEKNRRRSLTFQMSGSVIAVVGVSLLSHEFWRPIVYGSSLSFQIGAFVFENRGVLNQSILLRELGDRSGSTRSAEGL